ncbi:MAG: hypothetical protein J0L61_02510 [Planctomycetes bacterium]|nr:hypothetical protein [Planctomycetota bacterium]
MDAMELRKRRLHSLVDLARASRGWSKAQLARALDRDATKIYPDSGNPKADFLVKLAAVLEWPVGDVLEMVWGAGDEAGPQAGTEISYEALYIQSRQAHQRGDSKQVVALAKAMYQFAQTEDHRCVACSVEASGWDALGRYVQEVDACRRGLMHTPTNPVRRQQLRAVLANAWYSLWDLTPALGTCEVLAKWYKENPPTSDVDRKRPAFVHYVRGHTHRRLAMLEPELKGEHLRAAREDLALSASLHEELAGKLNTPNLGGIANTCRGGLIEVAVESGIEDASDAVGEIVSSLKRINPRDPALTGDWLESWGWWCTFGADIALRHLKGRDMQEAVGSLNALALTISERSNNWALRERVFTIQYGLHQTLTDSTGLAIDFTIEESDRSLITATMGRFPSFRSVGWQILETAKVVSAKVEEGR